MIFDDIEKAVVPSTAGTRINEKALQLWTCRAGVGVEVKELMVVHQDLCSVLVEMDGKEIRNEALVLHQREAYNMAYSVEDLLGRLEYERIWEKVEGEDRSDNKDHHCQIVGSNIANPNFHISMLGRDTQFCNDNSEETTEKTSFSSKDLSSGDGCIVPYVATQTVPANNTSFVISPNEELGNAISSHMIEQNTRQCHSMIRDLRKALELENLDDKIIRTHQNMGTDPRETSHFQTEQKVYGRDKQRDTIISKLTSEEYSGKNLSVFVIVGHGGIGKTTLAKVVYSHLSIKKHFDMRLWLHVSVYFNEAKLIRDLLECLCDKRYEDITTLKELQSILEYTWKSSRVLLVLDDVWEDRRREKWDELLTPLRNNDAKGNMILVTTRKPSVVTMAGATEQINLGGLHGAEFWDLFKECAFGDAMHHGHRKLKDIGKKIAVKLKGFPLAAKTVGRILKWKLDDVHWTRILDNSEWKDQQGGDDIMPALKISYNYLPQQLQRCFSYCSIFPKNYRYDEERLVSIWIAQGFVLATDQYTKAEEIGKKYLSDLIEWGFFEDDTLRSSLLIMHDLIHDLAQIVSSYESFTIEDFKPAAELRLIRHVSVITQSAYYGKQDGSISSNEHFTQDFARAFCTLSNINLGTLMLFGAHDLTFARTFQQALGEVKAIRVLKIEMVYPDLNSLISNISAFTNLRYLELGSFYRGLKLELPEDICKLYLLEVLDIKHSNAETLVPKGLNKLVNLRRFIAREELHAQIASVGKLIFLQELAAFDVRKNGEFCIAQLGELNELRRSIKIYNLQNLESREEATQAKLHDKIHLTGLSLSWDSVTKELSGFNIIEGLQPPTSIEKLQINGYNGSAPSWLTSNSCLSSLQSLHLEKCLLWYTLPPYQLLPLLQGLHLINMPRIVEVPLGGHLKVLELRNMPRLKQFIELASLQSNDNLEVIELEECHRLRASPFQLCSSIRLAENPFSRLQRVEIRNCRGYTSLPPFPLSGTCTDVEISNACSNYMSFRLTLIHGSRLCLEIVGNDEVQVIDETVIRFSKLKDLQELEIRNYPRANYFAWDALNKMASLKKFIMHGFTSLFLNSQDPFLPESLKEMEFSNCNIAGKQLSNLMLNLPHLKAVKVHDCKEITCFAVGMFVDESILKKQGWWIVPPSVMGTLEKFEFSHLNMAVASNRGLGMFNCLKEFYSQHCPIILSSMIQNCPVILSSTLSLLPTSLLKLDISDVVDRVLQMSELGSLVELRIGRSSKLTCLDLHSCTALQKLHIEDCDMLQLIQDLDSLSFLVKLNIYKCWKLTSVQLKSCTSLQLLSIEYCDALSKLDGSTSLTSLKEVILCVNSSLQSVELQSCRELERLYIRECPASVSWQGFKSFTGLKFLQVSKCPGFVPSWNWAARRFDENFSIPVRHLEIDDNNVLSKIICCQLTSLKSLTLSGICTRSNNVDMLSDSHELALLLLTSLQELNLFHFEHALSLPSSIHRLPSLQRLRIKYCPGVVALPDGGLPLSLVEMDLRRCSIELTELCRSISKMQKFRLYVNEIEV